MSNTVRFYEHGFGPSGAFHPDLPTAPLPTRIRCDSRSQGHHAPVEMMAVFIDTLEIVNFATLICPNCGVRRETTVEAACEHKWLCDGSAVLVM